jgi:dephospho-CoA kinase
VSSADSAEAAVPRKTVRIGLTGPIGCGKSTVAGWLGDLGAVVIDADRVARRVTEPGTPAVAQIARAFGVGLLRADGSLDRAALARIVFSDPDALARLEGIVHPAVRPSILDSVAGAERDGAPAVVIEAIKLVEGGLGDLCDEIWLVTCSPDVQRDRLTARTAVRGLERAERAERAQRADAEARITAQADAAARISAQADLVSRLAPFASRILDTSGEPAQTRELVVAAYREALAEHETTR